MASKEVQEMEPLAVSTVAPTLDQRRFSKDRHCLSRDEVDGLMESTEGRPFLVVHHLMDVKDKGVPLLLPGAPITCRVAKLEKYTTRSKVRVCTLYTVQLTHGPFSWRVKRKYKRFQDLHHDLYKHKMMLHLLPRGRFAKERQQLLMMSEEMPNLNANRERRTSSKEKYLEEYLNDLWSSLTSALSLSSLTLDPKAYSCLLYMNREHGVVSFVLLFDPEFKVKVGFAFTDTKYGVCIENFTRNLIIRCNSYRQANWWSHEINCITEASDFLQVQRHKGFAKPRENMLTKWYVNGSGYFADLADALEQAKEEIFITDWWLSPEVFLKRPATDTYWRLDEILKRKAEQGVKVCILLYKEVEMALGINSDHSKRTLMNMHPNIKVMRHPDHVSSVVFLWAHHEKMVAIDQSVAFVGGLDLAFGRWDDSEYRLTDLGSTEKANHVPQEKGATDGPAESTPPEVLDPEDLTGNSKYWLGKDYSNFIHKDWVQLDRPFEEVELHQDLQEQSHCTAENLPFVVPGSGRAQVQVLRSVDRWSAGTCENSILNAYVDTIEKSEHYVYIENQFFISCADGKSIHNGIGDAIVNRILRAHSEKKKYRVFVVVPLLPGFEGDINMGGGNAIQTILHFTYRTMCRGEHSILNRLKAVEDKWTEYITLCGLRTHDQLAGVPVTELIYVHSKFLIADDRRYIIGSANINDRSMLGNRDSELAVLVEDEERVSSTMGGQEYQAGPITLALRKECFRVLVGAASEPSINIDDPISDEFFFLGWNETAKLNTAIYDKVFCCLPCNSVHNMRELRENGSRERMWKLDPQRASEELKAVRGLLVHYPLRFLHEENLLPPLNSREGMAPVDLWT
ncbi:hypothetical protein NHX12_009636 [Muraenolepis orangiensis]|uniref:Phospholipase n=1 Tax=Muraenolepis orangiensis TaxID=630683 RepID=A0A9Q0DLJ5_9TELE|nr:hypothetical protein NHX12_009636 [Muraenolepis orangiensis]